MTIFKLWQQSRLPGCYLITFLNSTFYSRTKERLHFVKFLPYTMQQAFLHLSEHLIQCWLPRWRYHTGHTILNFYLSIVVTSQDVYIHCLKTMQLRIHYHHHISSYAYHLELWTWDWLLGLSLRPKPHCSYQFLHIKQGFHHLALSIWNLLIKDTDLWLKICFHIMYPFLLRVRRTLRLIM